MDKQTRLELLKQTAKRRPALSEKAATLLQELQTEDADIGSPDCLGTLAPDKIRNEPAPLETEDESEQNTSVLSPAFRQAVGLPLSREAGEDETEDGHA